VLFCKYSMHFYTKTLQVASDDCHFSRVDRHLFRLILERRYLLLSVYAKMVYVCHPIYFTLNARPTALPPYLVLAPLALKPGAITLHLESPKYKKSFVYRKTWINRKIEALE